MRSGRVVDNQIVPPPPEFVQVRGMEEEDEEVETEHHISTEAQREVEIAKEAEAKVENVNDVPKKNKTSIRHIHTPFPQRLKKLANDNRNYEILDLFKQVKINIPLLDAIKQISSYAKFLKDWCTIKRRVCLEESIFG